jgi:ADP-heptose:LPS heptosyltransferase
MTGLSAHKRILVIKHGALGDVVLAQSPFQAIRAAHPDAHITLLTTKAFKGFLEKSGLFDDVWVDDKPKLWNLRRLMRLKARLRNGEFDRVYDLQTSSRTASYFKGLSNPKPEWSGVAPGCSHPHQNKERGKLHTLERQAEQLRDAGLVHIPNADFGWAIGDIETFSLAQKYALLVPGGSAHRPEKRWPAERYGQLANILAEKDVQPVILGGAAEADVIEHIMALCPAAIDLSGKTSLEDIASLGAKAVLGVGNDTGPLHLIAAVDCPVTVLFSAASDPTRARPRGADVNVLRKDPLADLSLQEVVATVKL